MDENKLPFNYKTISYVRKILQCPEVDDDVKEFRNKENKIKKQFTDIINKDFRTKFLKENLKFHEDIRKVLEFYCYTKNVAYC